ncbi:MAG: hypothetical protein AB7F64_07870, partial [Gammaproteobacteria bacterium]
MREKAIQEVQQLKALRFTEKLDQSAVLLRQIQLIVQYKLNDREHAVHIIDKLCDLFDFIKSSRLQDYFLSFGLFGDNSLNVRNYCDAVINLWKDTEHEDLLLPLISNQLSYYQPIAFDAESPKISLYYHELLNLYKKIQLNENRERNIIKSQEIITAQEDCIIWKEIYKSLEKQFNEWEEKLKKSFNLGLQEFQSTIKVVFEQIQKEREESSEDQLQKLTIYRCKASGFLSRLLLTFVINKNFEIFIDFYKEITSAQLTEPLPKILFPIKDGFWNQVKKMIDWYCEQKAEFTLVETKIAYEKSNKYLYYFYKGLIENALMWVGQSPKNKEVIPRVCFVVTGSLARKEAVLTSDLDLFVMVSHAFNDFPGLEFYVKNVLRLIKYQIHYLNLNNLSNFHLDNGDEAELTSHVYTPAKFLKLLWDPESYQKYSSCDTENYQKYLTMTPLSDDLYTSYLNMAYISGDQTLWKEYEQTWIQKRAMQGKNIFHEVHKRILKSWQSGSLSGIQFKSILESFDFSGHSKIYSGYHSLTLLLNAIRYIIENNNLEIETFERMDSILESSKLFALHDLQLLKFCYQFILQRRWEMSVSETSPALEIETSSKLVNISNVMHLIFTWILKPLFSDKIWENYFEMNDEKDKNVCLIPHVISDHEIVDLAKLCVLSKMTEEAILSVYDLISSNGADLRERRQKFIDTLFSFKYSSKIIETLYNRPNCAGIRQRRYRDAKIWKEALEVLKISEEPSDVQIIGPVIGRTKLPKDIYDNLLERKIILKNGCFNIKDNIPELKGKTGNHIAVPVEYNGKKFFIKVYPEYPGHELALNALVRRLISTPNREIELVKWSLENNHYPVLISEYVDGESLYNCFTQNIEISPSIKDFSEQVIISLITRLEDDSEHNRFFTKDGLLRVVDSDHYGVPDFEEDRMRLKSIILTLDAMKYNFDSKVKQDLCFLSPIQVIEGWIAEVKEIGLFFSSSDLFDSDAIQNYQKEKSGFFSKKRLEDISIILPYLNANLLINLYDDMTRLQKYFSEISMPNELVQLMFPRLALEISKY